MALPTPPINPDTRIPNNPFYAPEGSYLYGPTGPLIVGSGLSIDYLTGTISAGGSGPGGITTLLGGAGIYVGPNVGGVVTVANTGVIGITAGNGIQVVNNAGNFTIINTAPASAPTGTVTQINTGAGLIGGPITTTGTIGLTMTGVSPGTYTNPTITVDSYGRLTFVTPGVPSGATGILATAPLQVTSGVFPQTISIAAASTSASGAVRLNDTVTSTSTSEAATPRAVKESYDLASLAASNAALACTTANTALTNANNACSIAQTAQTCALQALTNAAIAQGCANQALADAATAQTTANTALSIATSTQTAVNTALSSANNRIPCSAFLAKGNLLAGTAAGTYANVSAGTDGFVLTACSACSTGLTWVPAGGGAGGTVTSITAGTGLNGGTITSAGTIDLADTTVAPGSYTYGSFTVDQQGRLTAAADGVAPVTAVTGTAPISVTAGTTPDISVAAASTTGSGVVQLNNTLSSNSTTEALTAAQGQILQNQINSLSVATNLTFAGTFDASLAQMDSVTTEGGTASFAIGSDLPTPSVTNDNFFVIVTTEGSYSPPGGGGPYTANRGDWFLSNGAVWEFLNVGTDLPVASTGSSGIVELATVAETQAGTSTTLAVTPAGLAGSLPLATPLVSGVMFGSTPDNTGNTITAVGYCALNSGLTTTSLNSAFGSYALQASTSGNSNTAIGVCALYATVSGSANAAVGYRAAASNTTGYCNVAVGTVTFYSNTTGYCNTAVGGGALFSSTTGFHNTAIGTSSQLTASSGCRNTSVGAGSMYDSRNTCDNTAVGAFAMCCNCGGSGNTGIGSYSMGCNTTGFANTAVGFCSQFSSTTGDSNTSVGICTLYSNTAGICNTAVGLCALYSSTSSYYNVAIGSCALHSQTSGSNNTAVGMNSMRGATTSSASTAIGNASMITATGSFNVAMGNLALQQASGGCNTSIGSNSGLTTTSGSNNTMLGWCSAAATATASNSVTLGNSSITSLRAAVTTITSLSDARDKTDVTALPIGLEFINSLNPVKFTWQQREPNEVKDGTSEAGFIAQELQAAETSHNADYLGLVYDENPDKLEASPGKLIPVLVKAIQELSAKVESLEAQIAANG